MEGLLRACQPAEALSKDILRCLVFNLDLWHTAPLDTQRHLLKLLHKLGQVLFCLLQRCWQRVCSPRFPPSGS